VSQQIYSLPPLATWVTYQDWSRLESQGRPSLATPIQRAESKSPQAASQCRSTENTEKQRSKISTIINDHLAYAIGFRISLISFGCLVNFLRLP
jgi:hypothetical protein